jgi:hypothetical protein
MKKMFLFQILFLLFGLKVMAVNPLRQALINAGSKDEALIIYENYSNSEKAIVWTDKIDQVIGLNNWNSDQLNILNNLKNQINAGIFELNSTSFTKFHNWANSWKTQAFLKFEVAQLRFMVTLVHDYSTDYIGGGSSTQDCNCTSQSDYCNGIFLPGSDQVCNGKLNCTQKQGCGLFWSWPCNGLCQGAQPSNSIGTVVY